MKLSIVFLGLIVVSTIHAQVIFDDFSGSTIDTSLWTVSTPFADSSVTESGGNTTFDNRGQLLSTVALPTDFILSGSFAFTGSAYDHFRIVMYTDGVQSSTSGEFDGLVLQFGIQTDGGSTANNIGIEEADFPTASPTIASATVPISLNTLYDFELTKTGDELNLYFDDSSTPIISTTSTYTTVGDYLAMYNREGAAAGSSISAGSQVQLSSIEVIPEPSCFGILFVSGAAGFSLYFKRRLHLS